MKSYSIEYAHIYTNESPVKEQDLCLSILNTVKNEIHDQDLSLVVMIDDYSFPDPGFQYDVFLAELENSGNKPDIVIRESQLIPFCDITLSMVHDTIMKKQLQNYIVTNKKYPCSLFIATWYLMRLGIISSYLIPTQDTAKKLINILPESFRSFEERGFSIIQSTPHIQILEQIENRYFE